MALVLMGRGGEILDYGLWILNGRALRSTGWHISLSDIQNLKFSIHHCPAARSHAGALKREADSRLQVPRCKKSDAGVPPMGKSDLFVRKCDESGVRHIFLNQLSQLRDAEELGVGT
jgi:hypothetical protein